jgi:hypothetical protein
MDFVIEDTTASATLYSEKNTLPYDLIFFK